MVFSVGLVAALVIFAGIVLALTSETPQNPVLQNPVASHLFTAARWLADPFRHAVPRQDPKQDIALNWGLAGGTYFFVGVFLSRTLTGQ